MDIGAILEKVEAFGAPLPNERILTGLARLKVLVAKRPDASDDDAKFERMVYADELSRLPGFAVMAALENAPSRFKWWPTWKELLDLVEEEAQPYTALRFALHGKRQFTGLAR